MLKAAVLAGLAHALVSGVLRDDDHHHALQGDAACAGDGALLRVGPPPEQAWRGQSLLETADRLIESADQYARKLTERFPKSSLLQRLAASAPRPVVSGPDVILFVTCLGAIAVLLGVLYTQYSVTLVDFDDGLEASAVSIARDEKHRRTWSRTQTGRSSLHLMVGDLSCVIEESASALSDAPVAEATAKMSTRSTTMGLVTVMVGAGVLALPETCAKLGWGVAALVIPMAGALNYYVCNMLVESIERASQRGPVTQFKDVAAVAFGPAGGRFADRIFVVFLASVIAAYIVLIAENLDFLLPWAKRPWILTVGLCVSCTALVKDVSALSKLAIVGVVASVMYVPCILSGALDAAASYDADQRHLDMLPPKSYASILSGFCVLLFGFCCCDTLTSFRANMAKPEELPKALRQAHGVVAIVYSVAGLVGYYGRGHNVQGNILNSMCAAPGCAGSGEPPKLAENSGPKMAWGYLLAAAVIANLVVSLPFSAFVLFKAIEEKYARLQTDSVANTLVRLATVAVLTIVGMLIPFFKEMLDLVASLLVVAIVLILPTTFAMKFDRDEGKGVKPAHVLVLVVGAVAMTIGVYSALIDLKAAIDQNPDGLNPFKNFFGNPGTGVDDGLR